MTEPQIKPKPHAGLRHVALFVKQLEKCANFYSQLFGMKIVWQPDSDNIYLSSGTDNLALHRAPASAQFPEQQHLDHIGFFLTEREEVDRWYDYLCANHVVIKHAPKDHRDGTRSFYCSDPDGNTIQVIYVPT